jgi:general secretion pathway protein I
MSFANRPTSSARNRTRSRRCGFTLVEVLAAMILLAIVLPAAMRGVTLASAAASKAQKRTAAAGLASSKLHELLATGQYESGNLSGDFSDYGPQYQPYRWEAQLSNWNQNGFNAQDLQTQTLQQLDLRVTWRGREGDQSLTVSTLVYSNAPVGPAAQPPVVTDNTKRGPLLGNVTSGGY